MSVAVLLFLAATSPARAGAPPAECVAGNAPLQAVDRLGEVVSAADRVYFQGEPRPCPEKGPCPWRRKAYVVRDDRVHEYAVSGAYSCVTYIRYEVLAKPAYEEVGRTTGWVPSEAICLHPPLRKTRADPMPVLDAPGRKECEPFTSTLEDEAALFNGEYRSATARLLVTEATSAEMTFELQVDSGSCHIKSSGTGYVNRPSVVNFYVAEDGSDPGPCFATGTFDDRGVHLSIYECRKTGCESVPQDLLLWQR